MYCKSQPSWENQDIFNCMHYEPKPKWNSKENSTIGCDIITKMVSFLHEPFYSALSIKRTELELIEGGYPLL